MDELKFFMIQVMEQFDGMNKRFDAIDQKFDAIDKRFDGMNNRFNGIDGRLEKIEERLGALEESQRVIIQSQRELEKRHHNFEKKLDHALANTAKIQEDMVGLRRRVFTALNNSATALAIVTEQNQQKQAE
ncbi:hypothetical protein [Effusibacillus consociatus]|uniref:t-SNARE coiled-coil homology domain-containing protein n=1 Tax=Effusibacillus consociatus TaxID=1117041 RepID=A0ABV9Q6M6_9BACL